MISEEEQSHRADEDYATARRHDYGPAVHTWVRLLAREDGASAKKEAQKLPKIKLKR
ncbi:hypothetical protein I7I51_05735 [Histoplasma capsulatum]|uniref:Uncharacterized protein n=1 Tax=Ajellomyces capsulatus TaxID=5037 RepID=A0A8A1M4H6_AJECA|nr:predicted protein [Histoplasma mississippiense (nom. inval.)]EDN07006.1 predicted protein [Histoplasma mississippiense (nom. inval.)]QSS60929.1 hypothetical protein I7I51_05735 [Histoplasma capsulatum]